MHIAGIESVGKCELLPEVHAWLLFSHKLMFSCRPDSGLRLPKVILSSFKLGSGLITQGFYSRDTRFSSGNAADFTDFCKGSSLVRSLF